MIAGFVLFIRRYGLTLLPGNLEWQPPCVLELELDFLSNTLTRWINVSVGFVICYFAMQVYSARCLNELLLASRY